MSILSYGSVLSSTDLRPAPLPPPRGELTEQLFDLLRQSARDVIVPLPCLDDPITGPDTSLALYVLYELHYRGFADVDVGWEWTPGLIALRRRLEARFHAGLSSLVGNKWREHAGLLRTDPERAFRCIVAEYSADSVSSFLASKGSGDQFREFLVHKSIYQLKEADPHSWAIPRLTGSTKAALLEIQRDEYGNGAERDMHQNLFGLTMQALGLRCRYNSYLGAVPPIVLASASLPSYFGLNARLNGALIGHLAAFEMTSVEPMASCAAALRRLGFPAMARHYFEVHVVADAHHEVVAYRDLAGSLIKNYPEYVDQIAFGAASASAVEQAWATELLRKWLDE